MEHKEKQKEHTTAVVWWASTNLNKVRENDYEEKSETTTNSQLDESIVKIT